MTSTTEATAPKLATQPALPTHDQAFSRFREVINALEVAGWERRRVDTFHHPANVHNPRHLEWTVRHHYTHGEWELFYEPNAHWSPGLTHPDARRAIISRDRSLPTVDETLAALFGRQLPKYFQ